MSRMDSEPQSSLSSDLLGTVVRPPSIRVSRSFKSTLSGRLTPRSSPSFRRSPSVRTPSARDTRLSAASPSPWKFLSSKRLLPWLIVIGLWAYIGLLLQSRWAHNDGQGSLRSQLQADQEAGNSIIFEQQHRVEREKLSHNSTSGSGLTQPRTKTNGAQTLESNLMQSRAQPKGVQDLESNLTHLWTQTTVEQTPDTSEHNRKAGFNHSSWIFPSVGTVNDSFGTLVGPFQDLEKLALGSVLTQNLNSCSRNGAFAGFVKGRNFMLVFHELSMTGSPLAMMELASEILSCGGKVTVVALSHKGGLLQELLARGIRVLKSKAAATFKAAARVDLLVAGSAVCASWIEKYSLQNKQGSKRLVWWIMENRREYFNRSKHMLALAKALIFLSESQLQQWKAWSQLEGIVLPDMTRIVPLSVNQELSLKAGLYERNSTEENDIKRLRDLVRAEMGLKPHDVLLTTLSSINPGKGQLKLLQAVAMVVEESEGSLKGDSHIDAHMERDIRKLRTYSDDDHKSKEGRLRLLIGSVGSKSNKIDYVQKLLGFVSDHPRLAEVMLWTPVTVHVASLYAASDAYVMNSQGLGETFGRVTVEAMAFSLPILGTNAGGTSEIVENNVTGMVHPIGLDGIPVLAQHIRMMLKNATFRENMGTRGRHKVEKNYLKEMMYENLARIFSGCLKGGLSRTP